MSDLGCSICQELFNASAVCVVTKCGHVFHRQCVTQWINTSKTCPSCRAACSMSALIRVYFTTTLSDTSARDIESVTDRLVAAQEKLAKLKQDNQELTQKLEVYAKRNRDMKNMVSTMDEMNKRKDHLIKLQSTQLKDYDAQKARADSQSKATTELRTKLSQMSRIEAVMNASAAEVETMLATETCSRTLAFLVVNLKKELATSDAKKNGLAHTNGCLNNRLKELQKEVQTLNENYTQLNWEFVDFKASCKEDGGISNKLKRSNPEGPTLEDLTSTVKMIKRDQENDNNSNNDSPYLRLAASSVGLAPLMRTAKSQVLDGAPRLKPELQKLSIFAKKPSVPVTGAAAPRITHNHMCTHRLQAEKENRQSLSVAAAAAQVNNNDKFRIETRLKNGAIKRLAPTGNPK